MYFLNKSDTNLRPPSNSGPKPETPLSSKVKRTNMGTSDGLNLFGGSELGGLSFIIQFIYCKKFNNKIEMKRIRL